MGFETEPQNYSASSTKPVDGFQHHVFVRRQMWFAFNRPGHLNHWQKNKRQTTVQRSTWSGSRGTESETPYHYKKGSLFKIRAAVLDFARNRSWTAGAAKPNRYRKLRPMYRKGSTGRTSRNICLRAGPMNGWDEPRPLCTGKLGFRPTLLGRPTARPH